MSEDCKGTENIKVIVKSLAEVDAFNKEVNECLQDEENCMFIEELKIIGENSDFPRLFAILYQAY